MMSGHTIPHIMDMTTGGRCVYVGNLAWRTDHQNLHDAFLLPRPHHWTISHSGPFRGLLPKFRIHPVRLEELCTKSYGNDERNNSARAYDPCWVRHPRDPAPSRLQAQWPIVVFHFTIVKTCVSVIACSRADYDANGFFILHGLFEVFMHLGLCEFCWIWMKSQELNHKAGPFTSIHLSVCLFASRFFGNPYTLCNRSYLHEWKCASRSKLVNTNNRYCYKPMSIVAKNWNSFCMKRGDTIIERVKDYSNLSFESSIVDIIDRQPLRSWRQSHSVLEAPISEIAVSRRQKNTPQRNSCSQEGHLCLIDCMRSSDQSRCPRGPQKCVESLRLLLVKSSVEHEQLAVKK